MNTRDPSPLESIYSKYREAVAAFLRNSKAFWRTRSAVIKGAKVWDLSGDELSANGYLPPWKFNLLQVLIVGSSIILTGRLYTFFLQKNKPTGTPELSELHAAVNAWIDPFVIPLAMTIYVSAIGWGSVRARHSTPLVRARSRAIYLYLDGALGLWPKLFVGLVYLGPWSHELGSALAENPLLGTYIATWVLVALAWLLYITWIRTPRRIFRENGYGDNAPWERYLFAAILAGAPLQLLLVFGAKQAAIALANLLLWVQSLA